MPPGVSMRNTHSNCTSLVNDANGSKPYAVVGPFTSKRKGRSYTGFSERTKRTHSDPCGSHYECELSATITDGIIAMCTGIAPFATANSRGFSNEHVVGIALNYFIRSGNRGEICRYIRSSCFCNFSVSK